MRSRKPATTLVSRSKEKDLLISIGSNYSLGSQITFSQAVIVYPHIISDTINFSIHDTESGEPFNVSLKASTEEELAHFDDLRAR